MAAAHVQHTSVRWFGGSGTSESTANFGASVAAGNLIVVVVAWGTTTSTINSVADTAGNTYTLIDSGSDGTSGTMSTYYAKNVLGGAAFHVTVTWSADPGFGYLAAHEASGLDTVAPLDQHVIGPAQSFVGAGTFTPTSTAKTTTAGGEYIFGATFDDQGNGSANQTITAGSGYTLRASPDAWAATESQVQSSAGSIAATYSDVLGAVQANLLTAMATFTVSSAPAPVIPVTIMPPYLPY